MMLTIRAALTGTIVALAALSVACSKSTPPEAVPAPSLVEPTPPSGLAASEVEIAPSSESGHRAAIAKALGEAYAESVECLSGSFGTVFLEAVFDPEGAVRTVKFASKNQLPVEAIFDARCFEKALKKTKIAPFTGSAITATYPVRNLPGQDVLKKVADDLVKGKLGATTSEPIVLPPRSAERTAPLPAGDAVELTTTDITMLPNFRADRASVLGARLGMTMEQAATTVAAHGGFTAKKDEANATRLYVSATSGGDSVLYFIWSPGNPRMTQITVFRSFEPWLQGGTRRLLHNEATDPSSAPGAFLGTPDRSGITLDVPIIKLKHITHVYEKRWLEVTEQHDENATKVVFALVSPDNKLGTTWAPLPR
jgi:hypothetical protein